jgi:putative copper resistance protein D
LSVSIDALSAALRALSFVALFQAAGTAIFSALFGRLLARSEERLRRIGVVAGVAAGLLVMAHYALEAGRMSGDLTGVTDPTLQSLVLHSSASTALLLRLAGLLLIVIGVLRRAPSANSLALIGAVLVLLAFTWVGHTTTYSPRRVLAVLLWFHLAIVAFWFGALLPLHAISALESPATVSPIVERFSSIAGWLVPALFLAGLGLAALLLPNIAALASDYGRLLLMKVAGFAALMGLAVLNKWRLGPALARGDGPAAFAFRSSVLAEYVLIVAVLGVTAVLTTFYSPEG